MGYEVQQTRWDRIIRRVSGSIGPGSRVSETVSDLIPVLDIERVPGELLLLGGTTPGFAGATAPGGVGQWAIVELFNPLDSNNLVTVTTCFIGSTTTQLIRWGLEITQIGTVLPNSPRSRDLRMLFPSQPVAQLSSDGGLGAPSSAFGLFRLTADTTFTVHDPNGVMILAPGTGISFGTTDANTDVFANFLWRERPVEQSELQF